VNKKNEDQVERVELIKKVKEDDLFIFELPSKYLSDESFLLECMKNPESGFLYFYMSEPFQDKIEFLEVFKEYGVLKDEFKDNEKIGKLYEEKMKRLVLYKEAEKIEKLMLKVDNLKKGGLKF
jgi:hypothetical protein